MTPFQIFTLIAQLSGVVGIATSMLAMGLGLTVAQILQPLKNARLVFPALLANFGLVPLFAYALIRVIPLEPPFQAGLIVLACAAGAPFIPILVQSAKGNIAFGVGLMVLLMLLTLLYVPAVLPRLLPGVQVNPWEIAQPLVVVMLIPLSAGLLFRWKLPDSANRWRPVINKVSFLAILVLLVIGLGLNATNILNLFSSGGILALLLFILGSLVIGFLLGSGSPAERTVIVFGTAQRNVSAAIVVAAQNFSDPNTISFVLVASVFLPLILLPTAIRLGARIQAAAA